MYWYNVPRVVIVRIWYLISSVVIACKRYMYILIACNWCIVIECNCHIIYWSGANIRFFLHWQYIFIELFKEDHTSDCKLQKMYKNTLVNYAADFPTRFWPLAGQGPRDSLWPRCSLTPHYTRTGTCLGCLVTTARVNLLSMGRYQHRVRAPIVYLF